jgi:hypothetical protein
MLKGNKIHDIIFGGSSYPMECAATLQSSSLQLTRVSFGCTCILGGHSRLVGWLPFLTKGTGKEMILDGAIKE